MSDLALLGDEGGPSRPLALHEFGGSGRPVLLSHATGMHGRVFKPLAESLLDQFHCWAIDLSGHGNSLPAGDLHWTGFGDDVLRAVDAIDSDDLIGIGHSLGGAALVMAELNRPGTFTELLLYEPAIRADRGPVPDTALATQKRIVDLTTRRRASFPSRAAALENFARKPPLAELQARALVEYVDYGFVDVSDTEVRLKCAPDVEAEIYAGTYDHDLGDRLDDLACPLTLFCGGETSSDQRKAVMALAERTGAPVTVLDHLGHLGPLQDPRRVASALAQGIKVHGKRA